MSHLLRADKIDRDYLIWLDILGFEKLTEEIAQKSRLSTRNVRDNFLSTIEGKIKELQEKEIIIGQSYGGGDDWLLVTSSIDLAFKTISKLLDHDTGYKDCEKIPLEIGIGDGEYDKWAKFEGKKLINENATISFLKTHIISAYREWYKLTFSRSVTSTFVTLTESVFNAMNPFDREYCKRIVHSNKDHINVKYAPFYLADLGKVNERGRTFEFLERIGKSPDSLYNRIDSLFVEPNEYNKIIEVLEENKIVFLVGDPEIGKTYCAARILWEYYRKGYTPFWDPGSEFEERAENRKKMSECKLPDHSVTYFEDPFGRVKYEDRQILRREIGSFISQVQNSNSRAILTSREEVFNEFEREKLSQSNLRTFTIKMLLMKPTFSKEKMKEILLNWAKEYGCKWSESEPLKSLVAEKATQKLPTPLSMRDFALSSRSHNDLFNIELLIKKKSKEVKETFAEEITNMTKEKLLFLTLVNILQPVSSEIIKEVYLRKSKELGLDFERNSFELLEIQFNSKINQEKAWSDDRTLFHFTHPSYEEGIVVSWNKNGIHPFFLSIMESLLKEENPRVRGSCGLSLIKNFEDNSFQDEAKQLIHNVLNDKKADARFGVAEGIRHFYSSIPPLVGLEYLGTMSRDRNSSIRAAAIETVGAYINNIPIDQVLRLIKQGLEDRAARVRLATVTVVRQNLKSLPKELILKALEVNKQLTDYTGWFISYFASMLYNGFEEDVNKLWSEEDV